LSGFAAKSALAETPDLIVDRGSERRFVLDQSGDFRLYRRGYQVV
jgi:hypothetical protein